MCNLELCNSNRALWFHIFITGPIHFKDEFSLYFYCKIMKPPQVNLSWKYTVHLVNKVTRCHFHLLLRLLGFPSYISLCLLSILCVFVHAYIRGVVHNLHGIILSLGPVSMNVVMFFFCSPAIFFSCS